VANLVDLTGVAMVTDRATLVDFDWRFNDKQARAACLDLHILKFTDKEANALIIGESGTASAMSPKRWPIKPHYQASLRGYHVLNIANRPLSIPSSCPLS